MPIAEHVREHVLHGIAGLWPLIASEGLQGVISGEKSARRGRLPGDVSLASLPEDTRVRSRASQGVLRQRPLDAPLPVTPVGRRQSVGGPGNRRERL